MARKHKATGERPQMKISAVLGDRAGSTKAKHKLEPYRPLPGVLASDAKPSALAMDSLPYASVNQIPAFGQYGFFPGYPILSELAQQPEYRKIVGEVAEEQTREWIRLTVKGDGDKQDILNQIEQAMIDFRVREVFRCASEHDGFFGRGQVYIDLKKPGGGLVSDDANELESPLSIDPVKIKKGSLVGFRNIEPIWSYPGLYNSTNPLKPDYYKPYQWYVMASLVHDSRLLTMISRPVPDILKAAYCFGGLSLTQLAKPYVDDWLRTRDSVSDIVHSFSLSILKTNMGATLQGSADTSVFDRADLYNNLRDNRGMMIVDKDTEEVEQINTPLTSLDSLAGQALERMCIVPSMPLVKFAGIQPAGLNASSDGEIRVWYDRIAASQEDLFREPLKKVLEIIQLHLFGEIDDGIDFEFLPLYQLSDLERAQARKIDAETDQVLIDSGVISSEEARGRVASDKESHYNTLNPDEVPEVETQDEGEEGEPTTPSDTRGVAANAG